MTMAIERPGLAGTLFTEEPRVSAAPLSADPAMQGLLARSDDRLLRDAGLARDEVLGAEVHFWREWAPNRALWSL